MTSTSTFFFLPKVNAFVAFLGCAVIFLVVL